MTRREDRDVASNNLPVPEDSEDHRDAATFVRVGYRPVLKSGLVTSL